MGSTLAVECPQVEEALRLWSGRAVLFVVGLTIQAGGLLRTNSPDFGLATLSNVPASLARLQRTGLVVTERDGNAWRVLWGERALRIARTAGVSIAE